MLIGRGSPLSLVYLNATNVGFNLPPSSIKNSTLTRCSLQYWEGFSSDISYSVLTDVAVQAYFYATLSISDSSVTRLSMSYLRGDTINARYTSVKFERCRLLEPTLTPADNMVIRDSELSLSHMQLVSNLVLERSLVQGTGGYTGAAIRTIDRDTWVTGIVTVRDSSFVGIGALQLDGTETGVSTVSNSNLVAPRGQTAITVTRPGSLDATDGNFFGYVAASNISAVISDGADNMSYGTVSFAGFRSTPVQGAWPSIPLLGYPPQAPELPSVPTYSPLS